MLYSNHEFGHLTEKCLGVNCLPYATAKSSGEYNRGKYAKYPTDPAVNFLSNLKGTGQNPNIQRNMESWRGIACR